MRSFGCWYAKSQTYRVTGIKDGSFLTVLDEDDEDGLVNVVIDIHDGFVKRHPFSPQTKLIRTSSIDDAVQPFKASFTETPQIPRKPRKEAPAKTNGDDSQNNKHSVVADTEEPGSRGVKRRHLEDGDQRAKRAKTADLDAADPVVVEDTGGAIIIDD